jgi:hypothetical protein
LRAVLLVVAMFVVNVAAQVDAEDEIVTGEVSLFDVKVESRRSVVAAMGLSLALPGMGHYYIDKPKSAFVYLSADLAALFGAIVFYGLADNREKNARSYAALVAGIRDAPDGEAYWRRVGEYMDAEAYNESVELSRGDPANLYRAPETWWRWAEKEQQDEYNHIRQKARSFRTASSFFVGALALNRILSVVDIRVFRRKSLTSGVRIEASAVPVVNGAGLSLRAGF